LAALPFALSVHPSSPAKTVRELIELARAKPGKLNFASSGAGGGAHLAGEMLKTMAKIDMTHVAYKGGGPAMTGLLTQEIDFLFLSVLTSMPLIKGGKVRTLAVSSPKRSPALPDVPAVAETPGLEGFESDLWYGLLAPAKTDPMIVDKIYQETRRMLTSAEFKNRFEPTGTELVASSPSEFATTIKKDLAKWATVIKASGAKMD
jgi:tripartite-type tricarboxylate transporter receptor subunit TctC